jgi:hypothetical protein
MQQHSVLRAVLTLAVLALVIVGSTVAFAGEISTPYSSGRTPSGHRRQGAPATLYEHQRMGVAAPALRDTATPRPARGGAYSC